MLKIIAVILIVLAVGSVIWFGFLSHTFETKSNPCIGGVLVPKIPVSAKNLQTGERKDFSTICQVPTGWQVVE